LVLPSPSHLASAGIAEETHADGDVALVGFRFQATFLEQLAARIQENCLLSLKAPVLRVTGYDTPFPYFKLENEYLPSPERISSAVEKVMKF